jgi:hypothetical protein
MSGKPVFGIMAAIGGLIALAALLANAAARADELADLRANNDLLQQRLDQLSQTSDKPDATPGTGLAAGSFPRSFLIPGTDTSLRVGGSVTGTVSYWHNKPGP